MVDNAGIKKTIYPKEELANAVIQGTGALLGIVGLLVIVKRAIPYGAIPVASVAVYGGSLVLAFLASALYHGIQQDRAKSILRAIDHCTIYILIAGTYTPVALLLLHEHSGWALITAVWVLALSGVILRIVWPNYLLKLRIALYLVLGWLIVAWGENVFDALGFPGTGYMISGGLAYTVGIAFYLWRSLPFNRAVWHLFVVAGSACFFVSIASYIFPAYAE